MTIYIGVDFHPYQQTLSWCDEETGETGNMKLAHDIKKVREYYSSIRKEAVIGIEASSRCGWFKKIVEEAGHKLVVGNPVTIRKTALAVPTAVVVLMLVGVGTRHQVLPGKRRIKTNVNFRAMISFPQPRKSLLTKTYITP